ncbi:hypothetical protein LTR72_012026 [Exophiala xenobiotica]|nr:hypothetical protein LTR72_012026 [Exophiala xenobiotica]
MGQLSQQELTADELLLAHAEANGYQRGAHREADEVCGRDKHVAKTKKNQDATLRRYIFAMEKNMPRKACPLPMKRRPAANIWGKV